MCRTEKHFIECVLNIANVIKNSGRMRNKEGIDLVIRGLHVQTKE